MHRSRSAKQQGAAKLFRRHRLSVPLLRFDFLHCCDGSAILPALLAVAVQIFQS